ncbi:MAG: hypothetical protein Q4B23_03685 [Helcococcus sp.]|nr:hypothetical protein [Helcococcus sp.]
MNKNKFAKSLIILVALIIFAYIIIHFNKDRNNKPEESTLEDAHVNYAGIENKVLLTDNTCKLESNLKPANGDNINFNCDGVNKEIKIENLYMDDINNTSVVKQIDEFTDDSEFYLIKQEEYGFTIFKFYKTDLGLYNSALYENLYVVNDKVYSVDYENIDINSLSYDEFKQIFDKISTPKPYLEIKDIKEDYLEENINHYEKQGFIKKSNKN